MSDRQTSQETVGQTAYCEWCGGENPADELKRVAIDKDQDGRDIYIQVCEPCLNTPTEQDKAREEIRYDDFNNEGWTCSHCGADYGLQGGYCYRSPDGNHWYESDF